MNGYLVESFDEDENAWVIETERTEKDVAEDDADIIYWLTGRKTRISES